MKRILLFLTTLIIGAMLWAQAPQSFSYQAVVRDASGQVVSQQTVGVRLSLRRGSANGAEQYVELHTATTNAAGLITLAVGEGEVQTNTMLADIDWASGLWFLRTEVDPTGGSNYVLISTQQLHSVPYALCATDAVAQLQVATLATRVDSLQEANAEAIATNAASVEANAEAIVALIDVIDSLNEANADALAALNAANDSLKATNDSLKAANVALQAEVSAFGTRMQQYVDSAIAAALQSIGGSDTNTDTIPTPTPTPTPDTVPGGWVDLGLPSGLLWATCNLGATSPEEYGDYYAWGETTTKSTYNWSTYQYANGDYNQLTKYCNSSSYGNNGFTDNLTTLLPEDDAATQVLGSGARIPTKAEWQELIDNTTAEWMTMNGVYGRKFTAANGNTLFLPAAGYRYGGSLNLAGSGGYFWSASLGEDNPMGAWGFDFGSGCQGMYDDGRGDGQSVRAVRASEN